MLSIVSSLSQPPYLQCPGPIINIYSVMLILWLMSTLIDFCCFKSLDSSVCAYICGGVWPVGVTLVSYWSYGQMRGGEKETAWRGGAARRKAVYNKRLLHNRNVHPYNLFDQVLTDSDTNTACTGTLKRKWSGSMEAKLWDRLDN